MHYYKSSNEIMQYSIFGYDIALIMHYRALFTMSVWYILAVERLNSFSYIVVVILSRSVVQHKYQTQEQYFKHGIGISNNRNKIKDDSNVTK